MAATIRAFDWTNSPLGPTRAWPQSLNTAVEIMLGAANLALVAWGERLTILYNDACRPVLGARHPLTLGRPFREVWPELHGMVEETLAGVTHSFVDQRYPIPSRVEQPEGWFTGSWIPLRDEAGVIAGFLAQGFETTARVRAEQALRESEQRFRVAADGAPAFLWTTDAEGRITFANERYRTFLGVRSDALPGEVWRSVAHPDPVDALHEAFRAAFAQRVPFRDTVRVSHPDLGMRWLRCDGHPRFGGERDFQGYVGLNVDVTDAVVAEDARRADERRLRDLQRALLTVSRSSTAGQMAAVLAHELNQPFAALTNYLSGASRLLDAASDPRLRHSLERAARQTLKAGEVIRRMRDFVAGGEGSPSFESLPDLLAEAGIIALADAPERGIEVAIEHDARLGAVWVDRIQIQQVYLNVVRNAIEAMEGSPRCALRIVTAPASGDLARVSVVDTGPGIPPEVAERLFQPFVTTKRERGTGVGLSICRTVVEAHGGHIWVEPNPAGGTIVHFTLRRHRSAVRGTMMSIPVGKQFVLWGL